MTRRIKGRVADVNDNSVALQMNKRVAGTLALFADGNSKELARTHHFLIQAAARSGSGNVVTSKDMASAAASTGTFDKGGGFTRMPYIGAANKRKPRYGGKQVGKKRSVPRAVVIRKDKSSGTKDKGKSNPAKLGAVNKS
jgi:hypothetical protein